MDSIYICDLIVSTHIGITDEERGAPQNLYVSAELFLDTSKAGTSDNIRDTIDYEAVANAIKNLSKTERNTIERFAENIAAMILKDFQPCSVKVSVWKHILPDTKGVAVTITRDNCRD